MNKSIEEQMNNLERKYLRKEIDDKTYDEEMDELIKQSFGRKDRNN